MENPLFFCMPSRVLLEIGARHKVAPLCKAQKWSLAAIVTDNYFAHSTGVIDQLVQELASAGISSVVYDGGIPDPSTDLCDEATKIVLSIAGNRRVDHIIAVGGGSNIDLAKALCLTIPYKKPVSDFLINRNWPGKPLPMVAIPTTAGTGSEITPGAILIQRTNSTKVAIMGNDLRPYIAIVDPELTLSCPPKVTADAGLDALTHAIESWLTRDAAEFELNGDPDPGYSGRNRVTTMFAKASVELCFEHLEKSYDSPSDLDARTGMAYASLLAAFSYGSAGLNAVHGIAYALAGLTHASHGSTNAVLLPYVMDALIPHRTLELAEIARLAGIQGNDNNELARAAPVRVHQLVTKLGIPKNLENFGVARDQLQTMIADGLAVTRLAKAYPIEDVETAYQRIVNNAFIGKLSGEADWRQQGSS